MMSTTVLLPWQAWGCLWGSGLCLRPQVECRAVSIVQKPALALHRPSSRSFERVRHAARHLFGCGSSCAAAATRATGRPGVPLLLTAPHCRFPLHLPLRHKRLGGLMGLQESKPCFKAEHARLVELELMVYQVRRQMNRLKPLAAAEEAANIPPVPSSSQAAYNAAVQRHLCLTDELHIIQRRCSKC